MADAAQAAEPSGWRRPYLRQTALPGPTSVATEGSGAAGADMVITHAPLSVPQTVSSIAGERSSPFRLLRHIQSSASGQRRTAICG